MAPREPSAWSKSSGVSSSYFNPSGEFGGLTKAPSFGDYSNVFSPKKDETFSRTWKTGFDAENNGEGISSLFSSLFDKAKKTDKYRQQSEEFGSNKFGGSGFGSQGQGIFGGEWSKGGGGQVLENLGVVYPQQISPMVIPGVEGKKGGLGSAIGGLVGIGASFIPGMGPGIAAALPAIGSGVGGLFG